MQAEKHHANLTTGISYKYITQSIYKIALARGDSTDTTTTVILRHSGYSVITPGSGTFSFSVSFRINIL